MVLHVSPRIEEFFNRVHSKADGKFSTSGTGGGHYKGRAAGKPAPKGSGGASKAAAPAAKGAARSMKDTFYKAQPVPKPNATLAARRAFQDARDAKKAPPPPPPKSSGSPFPKPTPNVKPNAMRPVSDFKKKAPPTPPKDATPWPRNPNYRPPAALLKGSDKSNDKGFAVGGKDKSNDKGFDIPKKITLSDRLKNVGRFAKKLGDRVAKDNMTGREYQQYQQSHNKPTKKLSVREALSTGRAYRQRNP